MQKKENDLYLFGKWYSKNKNSDFAKSMNELEIAIAEEMSKDFIDYMMLSEKHNVAVVILTGTRRVMVDRWKKTVAKKDVGNFKIDMVKVRKKLKSLREEHCYTIQELSKKIKISRSAILSWESLWTNPNLDSLLTIAEFYNISLNQLLLECLM